MSEKDSNNKWELKINGLREDARKREEKRIEQEVIKLPLWSEIKRGTPNSFLRSALFSAVQSKDRKYIDDEIVFSQKDVTIKFTGKQLNQEDLTIWETLVHLARESPLGTECTFSTRGILKAMNMIAGGEQQKRLHSALLRLTSCSVTITHLGKTYTGHLIESSAKEERTKHYTIKLDKHIIKLYGSSQWTAIDWEQRLELRCKPLAQALHGYYSTHKQPHPVKLETLHALVGSDNKNMAAFKQKINAALTQLKEIGFLKSFEIKNNLVYVNRVSILSRNM